MCFVETGDVVVVQRQRTGGKVFDKMASTSGPGDEQHVVSYRQQPRESDLGWCRVVAGSNTVDDWIVLNGVMLFLWPSSGYLLGVPRQEPGEIRFELTSQARLDPVHTWHQFDPN